MKQIVTVYLLCFISGFVILSTLAQSNTRHFITAEVFETVIPNGWRTFAKTIPVVSNGPTIYHQVGVSTTNYEVRFSFRGKTFNVYVGTEEGTNGLRQDTEIENGPPLPIK